MLRKLTLGIGAGALAAALIAPGAAHALPPAGDLAAAVQGGVVFSPNTCTAPSVLGLNNTAGTTASFEDVVIAGAFTAGTEAFAGTVGVDPVAVCSANIASPLLNPLPPTIGRLGGAGFSGNTLGLTCVGGNLAPGGLFISAGAVSVAVIGTSWTVDTGCNGGGTASGAQTAVAVVEAVPINSVTCAVSCQLFDVIVGEVVA